MYFVFFKIFNFNSSQMKYFSCQFHFPFFLLLFFKKNLFGFSKKFAPFAKFLSWGCCKRDHWQTLFLFSFSFSTFSYTKSERNLENISFHFLIYLLSNIFVSYFCCSLYSFLPFTIFYFSYYV